MLTLSIAVWIRPGIAVGLVLCSFVLEQWAQAGSGLFVSYYQLTNIATALIVMMAFTSMMIQRQMRFPGFGKAGWMFIVLYAYCALSVLWSIDRGATISNLRGQAPYIIMFCLVAPLTAHNTKAIRDALVTVALLGSFLLVTLMMNPNWGHRGVRLAIEGTTGFGVDDIGNPLEVASMAGYLVIILSLLKMTTLPSWANAIRWTIAVASLSLIILSGSRGQFIGAVIAVVCFVPLAYRLKSLGGFFSGVFMVGVVSVTAWMLWSARSGERFELDLLLQGYSDTRLFTTFILLGAWFDAGLVYWILGLGSSASYNDSIIGIYPHFVPGEVLGELGFIGFAIYTTAYGFAVNAFIRTYQRVKEYPEARSLVATLGALLFFFSLLTLKQGSLLGSYALPIFMILIMTVDREVDALTRNAAPLPAPSPQTYGVGNENVQPA
ncbi:O-antigen ligase family protein [Mucisphaera calidilacus]|uniref:Uncharacterized protein n=1 Tax=Mucisphaera calidilacus TaxID=2527982 RepID=A0A518C0H0_9BACT|nr:hypothetical protein [Mucisphaera calidilacus]QDU72718.1 hypothetical protein Pan265_25920 [Mucisphaera calidilacus]